MRGTPTLYIVYVADQRKRYTTLRLHAISAAIPQALLLLHALMDILPYPKGEKGMWYELRTGSVECVDEVSRGAGGREGDKAKAVDGMNLDDHGGMDDIGGMEEDEPEQQFRLKVSCPVMSINLTKSVFP